MEGVIDVMKRKDLSQLLRWLEEDRICRWGQLMDTLRNNVGDSYTVSSFFCENASFFATGKIPNECDGDSMTMIAAGLGQCKRSSSTGLSSTSPDEENIMEGCSFDDIVDVLKLACKNVDKSLAFIATLEVLRSRPSDTETILPLLQDIINRCPDRAQRITTATGTMSYIMEKSKDIGPYLTFLRNMWSLEVQDTHNVTKSSLLSLVLRTHTSIVQGKANFREKNPGLLVANLVCCWESDVWSWISRICVYSSQTEICALDTTPTDEALCCFRILTDAESLMPRIYSTTCLVLMHMKIAKVFVFNIKDDSDPGFDKAVILAEAALELLKRSGIHGDHTTSPPCEFLGMLFAQCSELPRIERCIHILRGFLEIATANARIKIFESVLLKCASDITAFLCLGVFHDYLIDCGEKEQRAIISTLKSTSERLSYDVRRFNKSLGCVLSWVKTLMASVQNDSESFSLANDLHIYLTSLLTNDTNKE
ncbi:hypothetical protein BgAZ_404710 [Babesia gibsoni]|uniref:Uncharacterized protein n=1 Tax=Babesia gibsoni TaxID=33632 RepID=A0AAD8PDP8_BABGI|nr:hypothetical protein BgAZ_404710 [Babesia gibsoni]